MATTDSKRRLWFSLAVGLVVACLVGAVVLRRGPESAGTQKPPPRAKAALSRRPLPALEAPPATSREPVLAQEPKTRGPAQAGDQVAGSECSRSADCRGPKLADCILAACERGHCVFDRSSCECALDEECDDGVECTRDVCFAATKKCIHIRSACNDPPH